MKPRMKNVTIKAKTPRMPKEKMPKINAAKTARKLNSHNTTTPRMVTMLRTGTTSPDEVVKLIKDRPANVELILTGRYADPELIELADLVTEMVAVKHPFTKGVTARKGIEY